MIWVWCVEAIMNGHLLTNRLHGKAAELCLANIGNNREATTKYMSTIQ